ncbi:unnamed protein product [Rotaria magnacalcarata]|uniref:Uncharacterized protein n=1 Tax=Rotaria magnacalcarata TaxID=392030 RepID=A0A816VLV2_9BILA|nr:unnamed protein product [Rotaria magnacalcarata]
MPKRKQNKSNGCKKLEVSNSSTTNVEVHINTNDVTSAPVQSNDEDFLDNIAVTMNKRRKHLNSFYNDSGSAPDNGGDSEVLAYGLNKTISSNNTHRLQVGQSNSTVAIDFSSTTPIITKAQTMSRDIGLVSSFTNNMELHRGVNKSLSTRGNYQSDLDSVDAVSNLLVVDNQHDRSSSTRLSLPRRLFDHYEKKESIMMNRATGGVVKPTMNHQSSSPKDKLSSETDVNKKKTPYISKSIAFDSPIIDANHIRGNFSQNTNSFAITRSIIRLPDTNSQTRKNRPLTSTTVKLRTTDILNSVEYRELEKINRDLSTKVQNLKSALQNMGREQKKMKTTHMLKPRPAFWNEVNVFMNSYSELFTGDGRTIATIGTALCLNEVMIQQVQQNVDRPDKVAMNIWRKLCPTQADRLYVGSIKKVPATTLQNIYTFARLCFPKMNLNYKKMKSDIGTNIRQSFFNYKRENQASTDSSQQQENDGNDENDENDDVDNDGNDDADNDIIEYQEMPIYSQSFLQKDNFIDDIGDDEE